MKKAISHLKTGYSKLNEAGGPVLSDVPRPLSEPLVPRSLPPVEWNPDDASNFGRKMARLLFGGALLEWIFESLPCSVFVKDFSNSGRYEIANARYCSRLGLPSGEVPRRADFDIYGVDFTHSCIADDAEVAATWKAQAFKYSGFGCDFVAPAVSAVSECGELVDIVESLVCEAMPNRTLVEVRNVMETAESSARSKSAFLADVSHEFLPQRRILRNSGYLSPVCRKGRTSFACAMPGGFPYGFYGVLN